MMDDFNGSGSDDNYTKYWVDWYLSLKGSEYFCEIDEDYLNDRFNLTGLPNEVENFSLALDMILDNLGVALDNATSEVVEKDAKHLYGLIHARYILTMRGLAKMLDKMKNNHFGKCPRVLCQGQPLLPVGLSDIPRSKGVKLYCSRCEDIYQPKANRHINLDGAYFGTTFPHMLLQIYSHIVPAKSNERYVPRIYGFKIRDVSKIHEHQNEELKKHNQRALAYFQQ